MFDINAIPGFRPHPLLRSGHAQTIYAAYFGRQTVTSLASRHHVVLSDGDQIILHDDQPATWRPGSRVVLLLHGLSGSHQSPYLCRLVKKLNARGVRTFRMDQRGCGAGLELAQRPGHAGRSDDVGAALRKVADLCPDSPVTVAGFSLGGNLLLKLLGESSHRLGIVDSAVAVAPPIDLTACSISMRQRQKRFYNRSFIRNLVAQIEQRRPFIPALAKLSLEPLPRTLWEFDDRITAPLSGFDGAEDYYRRSSSRPLLRRIQVPTLLIAATDDPLIPVSIFDRVDFSSTIHFLQTTYGGHVGYVGRAGLDADRWWMDWRILDWIAWQDKSSR